MHEELGSVKMFFAFSITGNLITLLHKIIWIVSSTKLPSGYNTVRVYVTRALSAIWPAQHNCSKKLQYFSLINRLTSCFYGKIDKLSFLVSS